MINCIAIDDEPIALEIIKVFCEKVPFINLVQTFTQVSSAQKYLRKYPIDLIFSDIQMPDMNGLLFYKSIKQETLVIFTTAYSEYAVESFEVSAVDYLLKPFDFERFKFACAKAKDFFEYSKVKNSGKENSLYVRSEYSLVKIPFDDILYFETLGDFIKIHQLNKKITLTLMSLKTMEDKLPTNKFLRVHRSYTVHLMKVDSIRANSISINDIEIPIGSTYKKLVLERYSS